MKLLKLFVFALLLSAPVQSFAVQNNRPLAVDSRIRTYIYDPNEVFIFTGHYRYQSSIELAPDEAIRTISMGDSLAWQVEASGNRIFLKPIEQDATTNMTIVTTKRIYHFELYAEEADDIRSEGMIFSARFTYPDQGGVNASLKQFGHEKLPDLENEREKYHFNYTISGSTVISPLKIFDDGEFTYFEFKDKNADIPAFFLVDSEGKEALVNYRITGPYVVVERVASQFTLRHGRDVVCVFNESMPLKIQEPARRKLLGVF